MVALATAVVAAASPVVRAAKTLDIYFIDVEGGQSTLVVTPSGESLLIDAGFPNEGTFGSRPGDPTEARDPQRILAAAHAAGIQRIDYLMVTHFHGDHDGGIVELSNLLPIRAFIDHGAPAADAEAGVPGTMALFEAYRKLRDRTAHLEPKAGDRLPLKGVNAVVVATAGTTLSKPINGGGAANAACTGIGLPAQEKLENPRSTGIHLSFGKFRFLDVGDLSGAPLHALTCPRNMIGESEVYLVAHHGGVDAADPTIFSSINPLVAIVNNGPNKGGAPETLATLRQLSRTDSWQLHRSLATGAQNVSDERIANLDERTSAYIKLSAKADGSFTVTNGRTGVMKSYRR
jgi:beta-lactamase superfamily II metal-dependent hydrolase